MGRGAPGAAGFRENSRWRDFSGSTVKHRAEVMGDDGALSTGRDLVRVDGVGVSGDDGVFVIGFWSHFF
jgi:hypothetical protein